MALKKIISEGNPNNIVYASGVAPDLLSLFTEWALIGIPSSGRSLSGETFDIAGGYCVDTFSGALKFLIADKDRLRMGGCLLPFSSRLREPDNGISQLEKILKYHGLNVRIDQVLPDFIVHGMGWGALHGFVDNEAERKTLLQIQKLMLLDTAIYRPESSFIDALLSFRLPTNLNGQNELGRGI